MTLKILNIKNALLILSILFLFSCTEDEPTEMSFSGFEQPIITGYQARDFNSCFIYNEGVPNIRTESINPDLNNYIRIFPNPSIETIWIYADNENKPVEEIEIWIIKAHYSGVNNETNNQVGGEFKSGGVPVLHTTTKDTRLCISTEDIIPGYYRIYVKFNNEILWDNLAIKKDTEIWQF